MKKKQAKAIINELHTISCVLRQIEKHLDPTPRKTVEFRRYVPLPRITPLAEGEKYPEGDKMQECVVKGPVSVDEFMKLQEKM